MLPTSTLYPYREAFSDSLSGEGELALKRLDKAGTRFALVAYLPAGIDNAPHVFATGTKANCRAAYPTAKAFMLRLFPAAA